MAAAQRGFDEEPGGIRWRRPSNRGSDLTEERCAGIVLPGDSGAVRRMFDGPGTEAIEALPGAVERVLGDEGYRARAREIAANTALLPSVRAAPALLESIARGAATPV